MKKTNWLFFALAGLLYTTNLCAQKEDFSNCAAAFLGKKMIVNEYSTEGKCLMAANASGELTLRPVSLEAGKEPVAGNKIPFKVAIRGGGSRTLMLFSEKTYKEINIQNVLKACKKGDHIVLLTVEREWAVPHSEILVE
jgi:hypothetical protein